MDQTRLYQMQQEQHDQAESQLAQVTDLKAEYMNKRVKSADLGMLTKAHKAKYGKQTGIVTGILVGPVCGLQIAWEDGSESQSLPYMVTLVED